MNNVPFLCTKLFQKKGHYSRGDIIQGGTLFEEIRYVFENHSYQDVIIYSNSKFQAVLLERGIREEYIKRKNTKLRKKIMEMNEQPFNRSDSTSSQEYLTEPCKKRGFNWRSCWAKFGNLASISLIVVNVFLVFILFPLISSCISRLDKIVENQNEFRNLSLGNWALYSRMLSYLLHWNSKLIFLSAKVNSFKDGKISDYKTVAVAQSKNLLDWKLLV